MKGWIIAMALCIFPSCGPAPKEMATKEVTRVLSTTTMVGDLVTKIGGAQISHTCLITGEIDPHSYELVKGDDEKLLTADIIFYNGLGLEHGASLRQHLRLHHNAIALGDVVYQQQIHKFIITDGTLDPHFWMDVELFAQTIEPIVQALAKQAPSHADLFKQRGELLRSAMTQKDALFKNIIRAIPEEKRYLVTSHDAFYYFTKKYLAQPGEKEWKKRFIAPEGLAPDGQTGLFNIKMVSDFIHKNNIKTIFPETNVNQDALKKIIAVCRKKGLHVTISSVPLYGDTMGSQKTKAGSYLGMIEHNIVTIKEQLDQERN